jgi:endoglucanase
MGGDPEGLWQRSLVDFLKGNGISYAYWSWNPDSGDTGGILMPDWKTVDSAKLNILSAYQWPLLGKSAAAPSTTPSGDIQNAFRWS